MNISPTSGRFDLFIESLTPEERAMSKRLNAHLAANNMEMPSESILKGDMGVSAVFIVKMTCCLEDAALLGAFDLSSQEELKATQALVEHRRPLYKRRIARARLEDTLASYEAAHLARVEVAQENFCLKLRNLEDEQ